MEFIGFWEILLRGGPVMWPLLCISLAAVAFAIERIIAFNQFGSLAPGLTDEIVQLVKAGRWRDAIRRTDEMPGPVAAALGTVIQVRDLPLEDMEREASVTAEDYFIRLERFLPALDTFTTLSPLLGLLGTILGMVKVFQQFTTAANDQGRAQILEGVGESLYATAFGISIAIICFAVYNYFSARQRSITIQTDQAISRVLGVINEQRQEAIRKGEMQPLPSRKRRVTERHGSLKKTKVEIIPMIDTMFFLLVFFILSSVGVIKIEGTAVNLPNAVTSDTLVHAQITISIKQDGSVRVNSIDVKETEDCGPVVVKEIKRQTSGGRVPDVASSLVVINADKGVASGQVTRRIQESQVAGVYKFTIATNPLSKKTGQ